MRFIYCPDCGEKLIMKEIGDEGLMPYCDSCKKPVFDMFSTCIIALAVNEYNEAALIKQSYVSDNYVCVAGYMKPGESAEETAVREISEELGIEPYSVEYIKSYYFDKKDMLMLGFKANVNKKDFNISCEVDKAEWFPIEIAAKTVKQGTIAHQLIEGCIKTL